MNAKSAGLLGILIALGLFLLGSTLAKGIVDVKKLERTVTVKGLAQQEVKADTVIWPIVYLRASNDLTQLYSQLEDDTEQIRSFLLSEGFTQEEISISAPAVNDKVAQNYSGERMPKFRYSATQTITLYTNKVDRARESMKKIASLGKRGITFRINNYDNRIEYIYSKLNEIKPQMLQMATKNARQSAQTFADDSKSKLGQIKKARQGIFSISPRDSNTPYIKKVRVVSTVEYYLVD